MYTFDEEKLIRELKEKNAQRVLVQLPEGLKTEGVRIVSMINEAVSADVILSGEPLWGACDVAIDEAKQLQCDTIVMYGHAPFMDVSFPIVYVGVTFDQNIMPSLTKALPALKAFKAIGLAASMQHLHQLPLVKEVVEKEGSSVTIPEGKGHVFYDGQVLGCEYATYKTLAKDVDAIFVIANRFHALGMAMALDKPVFLLDPVNETFENMHEIKEQMVKQRFAAIEKTREAKTVGIIIGIKEGQHFGSAETVQTKLEAMGKTVILLSMSEVTNDKLINLHTVNAFIELACPRIALDAAALFDKPILTARECAVLCGDMSWEDILEKGFV